jgi:hypothetical protein
MLLRLVIIGLVLFVIINYWMINRKKDIPASRENKTREPMVACAHCGVYVAQHSAYTHQEQHFCCLEHLEKHQHIS